MATGPVIAKGAVHAELLGVTEVLSTLESAKESYLDAEVRAAFNAAATGIAASIRTEAPRNKYPFVSSLRTHKPTSRPGLLKRSIIGKAFKLSAWKRFGPGAFANVTLHRGAANRAPHANIIAPGRKALTAHKKRMVFFGSSGRLVSIRTVKAVPANTFWQRGLSKAKDRALGRVEKALERAWSKRANGK